MSTRIAINGFGRIGRLVASRARALGMRTVAYAPYVTAERIADCWRMMESQLTPGQYLLGDQLTVLDLYVAVVSRWGPRRVRFYEVAPRMAEVVKRVDAAAVFEQRTRMARPDDDARDEASPPSPQAPPPRRRPRR